MLHTRLVRFIAIAVLALGIKTTHVVTTAAEPPLTGGWSDTGNISVGRMTTLGATLADGRVLIAGGLPSVEIYDPVAGTWSPTGSLEIHLYGETMTGLPDGRVLVIGTANSSLPGPTKVHIYNPTTGTWSALTLMAGSLNQHTATLLDNGLVLVTGGTFGTNAANATAAAYLYNPASGSWTATGSMGTPRVQHSATKLSDGRVLVTAGYSPNGGGGVSAVKTAEIFDPGSGTWALAADLGLARALHTATALPDGSVLVVGGTSSAATERYHPATNTWASAGNSEGFLTGHTATLLSTGRVLVAGGVFRSGARLYDPVLNLWTPAGTMAVARESAAAVPLPNGQALVIGGYDGNFGNKSVEIYTDLPWTSQVVVTPGIPVFPYNGQQQFAAMGYDTEGGSRDVTSEVTWASSNSQAATIDSSGLASGVKRGTTIITATLGKAVGSSIAKVEAPLLSLEVSPSSPTIVNGFTQQFTATGSFEDGTTGDMTNSVTWTSSSKAVATIDPTGLATSTGPGTTTISATRFEVSASTSLTVDAVALTSIAVTPVADTIPKGTTRQFTATGTYNNGTTQDLSASVTWASTDTAIAPVDANGLATGVTQGAVTISATSGALTSAAQLTIGPTALVAIAVTPTAPSIAKGITKQFVATGTYTDGSTADLTSSATWTSSAGNVVWIVGNGLGYGANQGTSTIKAKLGSFEDSTTLTVTAAELMQIAVTPGSAQRAKGLTTAFVATGTYTDTSTANLTGTVTWASSNPSVATISTGGAATAIALGTATISATLGDLSGNASFTVTPAEIASIEVTAGIPVLPKGTVHNFTATATYTDATTGNVSGVAAWSSSDTSVATVDPTGKVTAVNSGSVTITAMIGSVSGGAYVLVGPAAVTSIVISPDPLQIANGEIQGFTATSLLTDGTTADVTVFATWSSSDETVAIINTIGMATALTPGNTVISASFGGQTGTAALTVGPAVLVRLIINPVGSNIAKGATGQFTATGILSDHTSADKTNEVTWTSSDPTVATITASGSVNALVEGAVTITATLGTLSVDTRLYVVSPEVTALWISGGPLVVPKGGLSALVAKALMSNGAELDYSYVAAWTSSDPAVATVSNGTVTTLTEGTTTITAEYGDFSNTAIITVGPAAPVALTLSPLSITIRKADTQQYAATATYSDGTTSLITSGLQWNSSDPFATIDANGLATGTYPGGTTTISARMGTLYAEASLTVIPATLVSVKITPTSPSLLPGGFQQFAANTTYSDGFENSEALQFTWTSSNPAVASVTQGYATAHTPGQTTITATSADGTVSDSTVLTVNAITLLNIVVTPENPSINLGEPVTFVATGYFSNGTQQDVTAIAQWAIDDTNIAALTGSTATGNGTGTASVTATIGGVTGGTTVTVRPPFLTGISVTPVEATIAVGATQQFTALGSYSDGTQRDLTLLVTWQSLDQSVATISAAGVATGVFPGAIGVSAELDGLRAGAPLRVVASSNTLLLISITPADKTISAGSMLQFTATGLYGNGSSQNLTNAVTWQIPDSKTATISSTGQATAVGDGSTHVTATLGPISAITSLTVGPTSATLAGLSVTPNGATIAQGATQQFTAIGTYSDGTTRNLTDTVTWNADSSVALISTSGLATGVTGGTTMVMASIGGFQTGVPITVTSSGVVVSIDVNPASTGVAIGGTAWFTATATYDDGKKADVTAIATWTSSATGIATIITGGQFAGMATGVSPGGAQITANIGKAAGNAQLTVSPGTPRLIGISVLPGFVEVPAGSTQQFSAEGMFSDGITRDVTSSVTWRVDIPPVASIDPAGLATALQPGPTFIYAELDGVSGKAVLSVIPAQRVLTGIAVTPAGPAVPRGATLQFAATGTYSDGSSAALTSGVTWASSAPSVATISPSGLATALATGTTTISATMGSVTGSTLMTVSRNKATPLVQATIHDESHQPVSLVTSGRSVHALINVSGIASVPTGTVKLKWFANASCSGKAAATSTAFALVNGGVDATGFAQAPSAAGTYGFLPEYSGDTLYAAAVAACQAVTVPPKQAPTLQTTIHDASHTAVTQAAVRTSLHPAVVMNAGATGTVTASWFANAKCSGRATVTGSAVLVNGTADVTALTVAPTKAGSYAVLVSYGGDNTFLAATGTCQVVTVR